jgi:hypothetical protein
VQLASAGDEEDIRVRASGTHAFSSAI